MRGESDQQTSRRRKNSQRRGSNKREYQPSEAPAWGALEGRENHGPSLAPWQVASASLRDLGRMTPIMFVIVPRRALETRAARDFRYSGSFQMACYVSSRALLRAIVSSGAS